MRRESPAPEAPDDEGRSIEDPVPPEPVIDEPGRVIPVVDPRRGDPKPKPNPVREPVRTPSDRAAGRP